MRLREEMCGRFGVSSTQMLTYNQASKAVWTMRERWKMRPENERKREQLHQNYGYTVMARTGQSNFRTWLYVTYEGQAWVHWYCMLGDLPEDLIESANDYIEKRVRQTENREPRTGRHSGSEVGTSLHRGGRSPRRRQGSCTSARVPIKRGRRRNC